MSLLLTIDAHWVLIVYFFPLAVLVVLTRKLASNLAGRKNLSTCKSLVLQAFGQESYIFAISILEFEVTNTMTT